MPMEEAKRRALEFGQLQGSKLLPASWFADAIWPGHRMEPQGAGAAASRVLVALRREGRAGWESRYSGGRRSDWGWWAR